MRKQINRIVEEVGKWMMELEYTIHPEKKFDEYDKKAGTTTPPEVRKQLQEIIVNKAYDIKSTNAAHINTLNDIPKVANLFYFQHWTVYISKAPKRFVTTDNPLAVRFPKSDGVLRGQTFLERAHYFPLTPDIFILATESDDPPDKPGIRLQRKTLFAKDEGQILDLNSQMVSQAHKYIYANDKRDLEDMLAVVEWQKKYFATPEGKIAKEKLDAERLKTG